YEDEVRIAGEGGTLDIKAFPVMHGETDCVGLRVGDLAYLPDVSEMYDSSWEELRGIDCWIVDALRRRPHPSHVHLAKSLRWIARVAPRQAYLTNMHVDLDYDTVKAETPDNVCPAHDGLVIEFEI
ncbi:MAG: MBL fold metallo-hydrolase, partial [Rhodobacteraceae bacterium]|nr:MBL fold metallo-hydrolase [Paracoccaceae bacterium]